MWQRKGSEFGLQGTPYALFCSCALVCLLLGMILFVFSAGVRIGPKAETQWALSVVFAVLLEALILLPLRIWFKSVVLAGIIGEDVDRLYDVLKQRSKMIMLRSSGLMRNANCLIQHFNPACRAARYFPELDISRLLLSLNDNDFPSSLNSLLWPTSRHWCRRLLIDIIHVLPLSALVVLPEFLQNLLLDVFVVSFFAVVFVGLSISLTYRVFVAAALLLALFGFFWLLPYLHDVYKLRKSRILPSTAAAEGRRNSLFRARARSDTFDSAEGPENVVDVADIPEVEYDYSLDDAKMLHVKSLSRWRRLQDYLQRLLRRNRARVYNAEDFADVEHLKEVVDNSKETVVDDHLTMSAKREDQVHSYPITEERDLHHKKKKRKHKSRPPSAAPAVAASGDEFVFHLDEDAEHPLRPNSRPAALLNAAPENDPFYQILSKQNISSQTSPNGGRGKRATNAYNPTHVTLREDEAKESVLADVPIGTIVHMGAGELVRAIPAQLAATGDYSERRKRQDRRQMYEQQQIHQHPRTMLDGGASIVSGGRSNTSAPTTARFMASTRTARPSRPVSPDGHMNSAVQDVFSVSEMNYAVTQRLNAHLHNSMAHEEINWNITGSEYVVRGPSNFNPAVGLEREFVTANFANTAHSRPQTAGERFGESVVIGSRPSTGYTNRRQQGTTGRESGLQVGEAGWLEDNSVSRSVSPEAQFHTSRVFADPSHASVGVGSPRRDRQMEVIGNSVVSTTSHSRIAVNYGNVNQPSRVLMSQTQAVPRPEPPPNPLVAQLFSRTAGAGNSGAPSQRSVVSARGGSAAPSSTQANGSQVPTLLVRSSQLPSARPRSAYPASESPTREQNARPSSGLAQRFVSDNNRALRRAAEESKREGHS
jgi:hypothetical protein